MEKGKIQLFYSAKDPLTLFKSKEHSKEYHKAVALQNIVNYYCSLNSNSNTFSLTIFGRSFGLACKAYKLYKC